VTQDGCGPGAIDVDRFATGAARFDMIAERVELAIADARRDEDRSLTMRARHEDRHAA